jgi:periplasmic divalent cation tolerance protein
MTDNRLVLTTVASHEEAQKIARGLVERRLAACVNILPKVQSIYRWQEKIEETEEWLLIIKTKQHIFERLRDAIVELHTYDVPEIICFAIEDGSRAYLQWLGDSVE